MIPRYSRPEMVALWEPATKFRIWYEIEAHACDAMADLGVIPRENADAVWKAKDVEFDVARIDEIEAVTKHDVIAFLTHLAEHVGSEEARFRASGHDLFGRAGYLPQRSDGARRGYSDRRTWTASARRAEDAAQWSTRMTVRVGRSHGIHAEPTTMGLTFARFYAEMDRNKNRLEKARWEVATGAISGAVGTFANIDPAVEEHVCDKLGLRARADLHPGHPARPPRDVLCHSWRHGLVSIENIAVLRSATCSVPRCWKGPSSSRWARKAPRPCRTRSNPVLTENLTGLARLVRMTVIPAMENVALWHERDISHSSVERMIGPDATVTLDFALARLTGVIDKMLIFPENMLDNMNKFPGLVMSQRVLLALTQAGVSREDAYTMVQRNALKVWEHRTDFREELLADADVVAALGVDQIEEKFDMGYHTKHVDTIFDRVFGDS